MGGQRVPGHKIHVPHLGKRFLRGNVLQQPSGRHVEIEPDAADRKKVGKRTQRTGLLYSEGHADFNPAAWPYVVEPVVCEDGSRSCRVMSGGMPVGESWSTCRLVLGSEEEGESSAVYVAYGSVSARLMRDTEFLLRVHGACREGDGVGRMVGIGDHLAYDGHQHAYVTERASDRKSVCAAMEWAGAEFARQFAGRDVGWEEMLAIQRDLWPTGTPPWPQHWDASRDLGNSMHVDPDHARSFAVWMSRCPESGEESWWLLFPCHGLAVKLTHGAWVSWDGRVQPHCSAVPNVEEGNALMSLFCSLPARLCVALARDATCASICVERGAALEYAVGARAYALARSLSRDQKVMVRFPPGGSEQRAASPREELMRGGFCKSQAVWGKY